MVLGCYYVTRLLVIPVRSWTQILKDRFGFCPSYFLHPEFISPQLLQLLNSQSCDEFSFLTVFFSLPCQWASPVLVMGPAANSYSWWYKLHRLHSGPENECLHLILPPVEFCFPSQSTDSPNYTIFSSQMLPFFAQKGTKALYRCQDRKAVWCS